MTLVFSTSTNWIILRLRFVYWNPLRVHTERRRAPQTPFSLWRCKLCDGCWCCCCHPIPCYRPSPALFPKRQRIQIKILSWNVRQSNATKSFVSVDRLIDWSSPVFDWAFRTSNGFLILEHGIYCHRSPLLLFLSDFAQTDRMYYSAMLIDYFGSGRIPICRPAELHS